MDIEDNRAEDFYQYSWIERQIGGLKTCQSIQYRIIA